MWLKEVDSGNFLLSKAGLADAFNTEKIAWKTLKDLSAALEARASRQNQAFADAQTTANALTDPDSKAKAIAAAPLIQETAQQSYCGSIFLRS